MRKDINILVYETDPDIQYLYQEYMNVISPHVSCTIIDDIEKLINGNDNSIVQQIQFYSKI